ncbi:MAG TPA: MFS transporter [Oscillatoriaceae cyanobacterium]
MFADGSRLGARVMPALALGIFLGALDMNVLALALPRLGVVFDVGPDGSIWLVTTFSAAYLIAMPIVGRLGDLRGCKPLFRLGLVLFTLGSLLCAISGLAGHDYALMLLGRAVQGFGAGGIVPLANAIIAEAVPRERRGKALGVVGMCFGGASILGPLLGGALLALTRWEWLFLLNVPLGLVAIALAKRLPDTWPAARGRVDWGGAACLAVFLGAGLVAAERFCEDLRLFMPPSWGHVPAIATLSALALVAFVLRERRAASPILEPGLYRIRALRRSFGTAFCYGAGMLAAMVFTPLYLHYRYALDAFHAGLGLVPMALGVGLGAMRGGKLSDRHGPRAVLLGGLPLFGLGLAALGLFGPQLPLFAALAVLFAVGAGFGACQAPLSHAALEAAPADRHGQATGALNAHRSLGGVAATTAGALLLASAMSGIGSAIAQAVGPALPPTCLIPQVIDPNHVRDMLAMLPPGARARALATATRIVDAQMSAGIGRIYLLGAAALACGWAIAWGLSPTPVTRTRANALPDAASVATPAS